MKANRIILITSGVVALAIAVTVSFLQTDKPGQKRAEPPSSPGPPLQFRSPATSEKAFSETFDTQPVPEPQSPATEEKATKASTLASQKSPPQDRPPVKQPKPKRELKDPVARFVMSFVGADADAEAYWLEAIFDASLPDKEREDLIEDLNEEGLSDHKQPGPEDFPLIMNRIVILEEIAPYADDFMLPHVAEAYKDLWNLAAITQGGGNPVR
jgi:hypothetical protein